MAPRKAVTAAGDKPKDVLAAVLLADSFTQRFRPMTVERPKALLPLVNVPMIDYTLEWLVMNGVEEVYVFCCAHAEQVVRHLESTGWTKPQHGCRVQTVVSPNCLSVGEALRAIDQKDIIKGDFILVSGDTVSNMDIRPALRAHKARREKDKMAIMTLVMREGVDNAQRRRRGEPSLTVAVDSATNRLLRYHEVVAGRQEGQLGLDTHIYGERDGVGLSSHLADAEIYICAPEVLMLFSDNFDYQNIRPDFVTGVLSEEELGNKLYVHTAGRDYVGRVHNLRSYDAVSRDILQRWTFPFVPDSNLAPPRRSWGAPSFRLAHGFIYMEESVAIARMACIGHDTCIGAGTVIEEQSKVETSVIGRNCRIGKGAVISGSYIQDDVVVSEGACIRHALVCEGVVIMQGAIIHPGSILSYKVVIGAGVEVAPYTRITLCRQKVHGASFSDDELEVRPDGAHLPAGAGGWASDGENDDDGVALGSGDKPSSYVNAAAEALAAGRAPSTDAGFDVGLVGAAGAGYPWLCQNRDGDDVWNFSIAPTLAQMPAQEDDSSENGSSMTEVETRDSLIDDPEASFKREVSETFLRCVKEGFNQDLAVIELNGLKIAEDRTFAACARYIFTAILALCLPAPPRVKAEYRDLYPTDLVDPNTLAGRAELVGGAGQNTEGRLGMLLNKWGSLLQRFLKNEDDQVELLLTFEEFCSEEGIFEGTGEGGNIFAAVFPQVLKMMYDKDIIEEKAFLDWADEKEHADEDEREYLDKAIKFITWLREAEEEDDDDAESGTDRDSDST